MRPLSVRYAKESPHCPPAHASGDTSPPLARSAMRLLGRHLMLAQMEAALLTQGAAKARQRRAQSPDTGHSGPETTAQCVVCERQDAANKPHHRKPHVCYMLMFPMTAASSFSSFSRLVSTLPHQSSRLLWHWCKSWRHCGRRAGRTSSCRTTGCRPPRSARCPAQRPVLGCNGSVRPNSLQSYHCKAF